MAPARIWSHVKPVFSIWRRLSTLTGHLPHEVLGVSAHKYLHPSDMAIAMFAQKQMFASNTGKGVVVYRLRTRDDSFIFLRSSGYLQYDQGTMQVGSLPDTPAFGFALANP